MTYPKLISWTYWDGTSIFSKKSEHEKLTLYYANSEEVEKQIEKYKGIPGYDIWGTITPGITKEVIKGFTMRAAKHGALKRKYAENYPDLEDKYKPFSGRFAEIDNYYYIDLPHVKNYVNSITDVYPQYFDFRSNNFIRKEAFKDIEFLEKLFNYKPMAAFGGEIKSFQEKDIPRLLGQIKTTNKELYKFLLNNIQRVRDYDKDSSFVGRKVFIKTIAPGKIKLTKDPILANEDIAYWDGKEIEVFLKKDSNVYNIESIKMKPSDDYIAIVVDEDVITEDTVFL